MAAASRRFDQLWVGGFVKYDDLSQAVFANYLNSTADYVSKLERGEKRPSGPALVLLDVIRRKGIDAIL